MVILVVRKQRHKSKNVLMGQVYVNEIALLLHEIHNTKSYTWDHLSKIEMKDFSIHFFPVIWCNFMLNLSLVNLFLSHFLRLYSVKQWLPFLSIYFGKNSVAEKSMTSKTFWMLMKLDVCADDLYILRLEIINEDLWCNHTIRWSLFMS